MKPRNQAIKYGAVILAVVPGFMAAQAMAVPPDFTSLTSAVDYTTAIAAVLLVFAGLAGFAIVWKGGKKILSALGWS